MNKSNHHFNIAIREIGRIMILKRKPYQDGEEGNRVHIK